MLVRTTWVIRFDSEAALCGNGLANPCCQFITRFPDAKCCKDYMLTVPGVVGSNPTFTLR